MVHARARCTFTTGSPSDQLDPESVAFGILFGGSAEDAMPRTIAAEAWFDRWEAANHEVHEQSVGAGEDEILTLILIRDRIYARRSR
jgi:hypothetical protein